MANRTWETVANGNTGDYGVAANWVENAVPVNGDDVFIVGDANITAGLNQSLVTLSDFNVGDTYFGKIATSPSNQLQVNSTNAHFASNGSGAWIDGTFTTFRVIGGERGGSDFLHLDGVITTLDITAGRGTLSIVTGATLTNILMAADPQLKFVIPEGVAGTIAITQDGGTIEVSSNLDSLTLESGTCKTLAACAIANEVFIGDNGVLYHESSGDLQTVEVFGILDARANANGGTVDIAGTSAVLLRPNGKLYTGNSLRSVVATNQVRNFNSSQDRGGWWPAVGALMQQTL